MRVLAPSGPPTIATSFQSKISASHYEWDIYDPFTEALNYALGRLSDVEVDGLPKFKSHIVFVLCNKRVSSDRDLGRSSFKPDIALVSIQDARKLYELDDVDKPDVSHSLARSQRRPSRSLLTGGPCFQRLKLGRRRIRRIGLRWKCSVIKTGSQRHARCGSVTRRETR